MTDLKQQCVHVPDKDEISLPDGDSQIRRIDNMIISLLDSRPRARIPALPPVLEILRVPDLVRPVAADPAWLPRMVQPQKPAPIQRPLPRLAEPKLQILVQDLPVPQRPQLQKAVESQDPVTIGRYRVEKRLGKGGFGAVYLCRDTRPGQLEDPPVAIKVIQKEKANMAEVRKEFSFMRALHHPNIIQAYELFEDKKNAMIVMEYVGGGSLHEYISEHGAMDEEEAKHLFAQIVSAMDYCHRNSIAHRDLKPANVLIDSDKNIKIIDFGLATIYDKKKPSREYCGTPYYFPPEIRWRGEYIGPEVDIWTMGAILHAMLTGVLVYKGTESLFKRFMNHGHGLPESMSYDGSEIVRYLLGVTLASRLTMEKIKSHPWLGETVIEDHFPRRPEQLGSLDDEAIAELAAFGYNRDECMDLLGAQSQDHPIVALYHLCLEMLRRIQQSAAVSGSHDEKYPRRTEAESMSVSLTRNDDLLQCEAALRSLLNLPQRRRAIEAALASWSPIDPGILQRQRDY